jgi:transposase-like protein
MKCPQCGATQVSRYGRRQERQNYICKVCKRQFLESKRRRGYPEEVKQICLRMRQSGMSYREIERLTGVNHNTIINWFKKSARQAIVTPIEKNKIPEL